MDRRRDNASRPPLVGLGLLLASLVLQAQPGQAAGGPLSVRDEAAFKAQRECGRDCMVFNGSIDLIGKFGCAWPYQNDCFCRADLGVAATKHFSSCGTARCTVGPSDGDISTMISIYNSYCLSNGYEVTKVQAQQAAPTGASGSSGSRTTASTGSQLDTNQPAETGGSNSAGGNGSGGSESSSGGGLSAASIGIICSVVGVVIAAIGLGVKIAYARRGARADREASFGKADSQTSMPGSSNNNGGWYRERIEREGYGASRH